MSIETMKLALDYLDAPSSKVWAAGTQYKIITALRAAIEQAEKQEPVAFYVYKPTLPRGNLGRVIDGDLPWVYDQDPSSGFSARMLVYTAPPQRNWQGLTDEEIELLCEQADQSTWRAIELAQARLKEKNNG